MVIREIILKVNLFWDLCMQTIENIPKNPEHVDNVPKRPGNSDCNVQNVYPKFRHVPVWLYRGVTPSTNSTLSTDETSNFVKYHVFCFIYINKQFIFFTVSIYSTFSKFLILRPRMVSSAHTIEYIYVSMSKYTPLLFPSLLGRSAKNMLKSNGLNIHPCLTPFWISISSYILSSIFIPALSFLYRFNMIL